MPDIAARMAFPKILKMYMDRDHLSQVDIAKRLHVSKQSVSEWLSGKKFPRVDNMQELADLFGVLLSDMYTLTSDTRSENDSQSFILHSDEKHLIEVWRKSDPDAKSYAIGILEKSASIHRKKESEPSAI